MNFVLDASVALLWLVPQTNPDGAAYADSVLSALKESQAVVPSLFGLETANVVAKVAGKGRARRFTRVKSGHQLHAGIAREGGQHEREGPTQAQHTHANRRQGRHAHKSSTKRSPRARDTQTITWLARSSGSSTWSRWSASPLSKPTLHEPQVPLSHELATMTFA